MSFTPSPCWWTCSAISPFGVRGAVKTKRMSFCDHQVRRAVANLGLEAGERYRRETPQGAVVGGRLSGVAHPELDIVDALDRQEVLGLGVGILVDVRAGLIGRALLNVRLDQRVCHLENLRLSAEHTREGRTADVGQFWHDPLSGRAVGTPTRP